MSQNVSEPLDIVPMEINDSEVDDKKVLLVSEEMLNTFRRLASSPELMLCTRSLCGWSSLQRINPSHLESQLKKKHSVRFEMDSESWVMDKVLGKGRFGITVLISAVHRHLAFKVDRGGTLGTSVDWEAMVYDVVRLLTSLCPIS